MKYYVEIKADPRISEERIEAAVKRKGCETIKKGNNLIVLQGDGYNSYERFKDAIEDVRYIFSVCGVRKVFV